MNKIDIAVYDRFNRIISGKVLVVYIWMEPPRPFLMVGREYYTLTNRDHTLLAEHCVHYSLTMELINNEKYFRIELEDESDAILAKMLLF